MADTNFTDGTTPVMAAWLNDVNAATYRISGTTAQRPLAVNIRTIGQIYFDTTLGQPVWCKQITPSVIWVNAAGVSV